LKIENGKLKIKERMGRILSVLDKAGSRTITVFGDYCLDKYLYIDPARDEDSVETGLTAYQADSKKLFPGVGGTVTNNLRSLGVQVRCIGLLGEDGEGYELLKGLNQIGANTELMISSQDIVTSTYIKPMRKTDGGYAETNRIDIRNFIETPKELEEKLLRNLEAALDDSHGVVITEQFLERNHSAVTDYVRLKLAEIAGRYPEKFFYADSRGFASDYRGVIIKCNENELPGLKGNAHDEASIIACGKALLKRNGKAVVVTVGADGAYIITDEDVEHIPAFKVDGPIDIVGAGDATNAGLMLGLTLGLTLPEAVLLGGCVSSITIRQIGVTGTATIDQLKQRLEAECAIM
jgi:sugar/nucleoside kinase (ribokinase family)